MRAVTEDILLRAIRRARKTGRTVSISKTGRGKGVDVTTLDPRTPEGRARLEAFLTPIHRHYTVSGLGAPEERDAISWRSLNLPVWRRALVGLQVAVSFLMKGTPRKNALYRWMGVHVGRNVEIMQMAWLDHYRPELIWIGDNTLIGAFTRITVHAYEGQGRFRYGLVTIGKQLHHRGGHRDRPDPDRGRGPHAAGRHALPLPRAHQGRIGRRLRPTPRATARARAVRNPRVRIVRVQSGHASL